MVLEKIRRKKVIVCFHLLNGEHPVIDDCRVCLKTCDPDKSHHPNFYTCKQRALSNCEEFIFTACFVSVTIFSGTV